VRQTKFRFSTKEILQLAASTLVLAIAFSFPLSGSYLLDVGFLGERGGSAGINWDVFLWPALPVSLGLVLAAFVLHELAHKFSAQHYGLWAEFQASTPGLFVALGISAALGVVVAAPGAVVIMGPASKKQAGIISLWGPVVNIAFAAIALPLWLITDQSQAFNLGLRNIGNVFQLAVLVNVVLAGFNMIPIKPFDGSKIVRWSIPVFVGTWAVIGVLFAKFFGFI
jgi:Zn-dependent protease